MLALLLSSSLSAELAARPDPVEPPTTDHASTGRGVDDASYQRTDMLLYPQMAAFGLHAVDRVLRWEEAGFPFRSRFTGGTAALLIWPYFIAGKALDMGPLYWVIGDSINLLSMGLAHMAGTGLEAHPRDLYKQWVSPSTNLLGVRSPAMGRASQGILGAVFVTNLAHLVSATVDGVQHGFTWREEHRRSRRRAWSVTAAPMTGGMALAVGGAW